MLTKQELMCLQTPNWITAGAMHQQEKLNWTSQKIQDRFLHISSSGLTCLILLIPLDSLCEDFNCTVDILLMTVHCHQCRHLQTFKSSI